MPTHWRESVMSSDHVDHEMASRFATNVSDAQVVSRMRLVLAVSVLLTIFIDPSGLIRVDALIWCIFFGYVFHSMVFCISSPRNEPFSQSKLVHWLDVCWYTLMVFFTGGNGSFFLFFFFAILTSAFRWGFEEGARITIISAVLLVVSSLVSMPELDFPRLLMRTTFLLVFGYMSARWGESTVELKRRLILLRDVSRLSNPRFGVDHTITAVLQKTLAFFNGSNGVLLVRDRETDTYALRTIKAGNIMPFIVAEPISVEAAAPLMKFVHGHIVLHARRFALSLYGGVYAYEMAKNKWSTQEVQASISVAELLGAHSFIGTPLPLRKGEGCMYIASVKKEFNKADALFLRHIAEQAFPVIENIELLDHMASEAVLQERKKIALDIHDTAIQPYIGLKMALSAVRNKAASDNPLIEDLDKLMAMATQVIGDLRRYAGAFNNSTLGLTESILLTALQQQTAQVREFYGIDIRVQVEGELHVSDRLTVEVLQMVREGLSNICKHTMAQRGLVKLQCAYGCFKIDIENEGDGARQSDFMPRSIMQRASALGGNTQVQQGPDGSTVVHIDIPI